MNSVRVYIPVTSLDKDQETRLYKFTKEARSNRGHRARGDPYEKRVTNSYFSPYGKANEGNPMQASHLFDLCPGRGLPAPLTTGTDKEQRAQERQETAHRTPPVTCFLTIITGPPGKS